VPGFAVHSTPHSAKTADRDLLCEQRSHGDAGGYDQP